ncbi:hypothetical protein GNX71_16355 [Variovorax sp. RKNM96]|uniref:hypothetical protein n=1 Tax=Variovorax sp. RKNM96 TaxID=2681552 RepID=UPI00197DCDC3|nr:hypothetical protein [Variovorax sp. RKNM96]QSI31057.1 hypothetical protein GNX71_16355 [Variovorax sp. RKNM96]
MPDQTSTSGLDSAEALAKALKDNQQATKAVQKVADELAVVHAVLDSAVPKKTLAPDVDQAVAHTGQLEKQLSESSQTLKKVNDSMAREVAKRNSRRRTQTR